MRSPDRRQAISVRWTRSAGRHALHRSAPRQDRAQPHQDIDKDTVEFQAIMTAASGSRWCYPPASPMFCQWLVGIAWHATNIPPHNLTEVVNACLAYIDDPRLPLDTLTEIVPGPTSPLAPAHRQAGGACRPARAAAAS